MTFRQILGNAPIRNYLGARMLTSSGRGIELTIMVIFMVQTVGLSAQQVGFASSVAAAVGLVVSFPVGIIADRVGTKRTLIALTLTQAVSMAAFAAAFNFVSYLVSLSVFVAGFTAAYPVSQALAGQITTDATRAPAMAAARAAVNLGIVFGSVIALAYLYTGIGWIGRASLVLASLFMLVAVLFYLRMPDGARMAPVPLGAMVAAARDWRYGILALLMAPNLMVFQILTIGVPLWVTFHGNLPAWLVSVCTLLNALVIVTMQFPVGGRINTVARARATLIVVGLCLGATCALMALGLEIHSVWVASTLVIVAVIFLSFAEITETSARWELSYSLAPAATRTTHLSLFSMTSSLEEILGPIVLTSWVMGARTAGWFALGIFLVFIALIQAAYATWLAPIRAAQNA